MTKANSRIKKPKSEKSKYSLLSLLLNSKSDLTKKIASFVRLFHSLWTI